MRIVDAHSHIGIEASEGPKPHQVVSEMDALGVEKAVVCPVEKYIAVFNREGNDYIIKAVERYPKRLIGFATVNPWFGPHSIDELERAIQSGLKGLKLHPFLQGFVADCVNGNNVLSALVKREPDVFIPFCTVNPYQGSEAVKELRRAVKELGMKGLKLHPWRQAFSMTHPYLGDIIEETVALGVPVVFHDGTPPYSTPLQISGLAEDHPNATIILGHSGLNDLWPNAIAAAQATENIILCTCATPFIAVQRMVEKIGAERIVYGSDAGFAAPSLIDYNLNKIRMLKIKEEDKTKILRLNIARILGL